MFRISQALARAAKSQTVTQLVKPQPLINRPIARHFGDGPFSDELDIVLKGAIMGTIGGFTFGAMDYMSTGKNNISKATALGGFIGTFFGSAVACPLVGIPVVIGTVIAKDERSKRP